MIGTLSRIQRIELRARAGSADYPMRVAPHPVSSRCGGFRHWRKTQDTSCLRSQAAQPPPRSMGGLIARWRPPWCRPTRGASAIANCDALRQTAGLIDDLEERMTGSLTKRRLRTLPGLSRPARGALRKPSRRWGASRRGPAGMAEGKRAPAISTLAHRPKKAIPLSG